MIGILVHYFFENLKYGTDEEVEFSKTLCYKKYLSYFGEEKLNKILSKENIGMFLTKDKEIFSKKWDYIYSEYVLYDYEEKKEYRIDRYDNKDQPVFAGIDHKLDALMLANFALIENLDSIFDRTTGNFILSFKNEGYKIDAGTFNNEYNTPNKKPYNGPLSINLGRMGVANGGKERNLKKAKKAIRSLSNGFFD